MAEYIILAFTNPVAGMEDAYHHWYDTVAVPAYKTIPGLTHHGRYRLSEEPKQFPFAADSDWEFLSVYTFVTDDLAAFSERAGEALAQVKAYSFSETIDKSRFFEPMYVKL